MSTDEAISYALANIDPKLLTGSVVPSPPHAQSRIKPVVEVIKLVRIEAIIEIVGLNVQPTRAVISAV